MPTAKKTTTRKTATKKTTATKKVAEVKEEVKEEVPYEIATEKSTEKQLQQGEFVDMIFPYNPSLGSGDQYFEHCINGVIYRYKRGEMVHVPKAIADTCARKEKLKTKMSVVYSQFAGDGKKLDM